MPKAHKVMLPKTHRPLIEHPKYIPKEDEHPYIRDAMLTRMYFKEVLRFVRTCSYRGRLTDILLETDKKLEQYEKDLRTELKR